MDRYICIHCHFYQPPRENPWLEAVELQDSAYPYHDWNERITAECYAPNAAARILDGSGRIARIVNNYERISFNFGPTLLSWMEDRTPATYEAILEADRKSSKRFSGHGNAIAQAYNHMIVPLSNRRDRETQIRWGIRDFEHRFGRYPEGLWLPETAADVESLEILAAQGIKFTILAPHQAKQVRKKHARGVWRNVEGAKIDPTRAYLCRLPGGNEITVFFYDGPISRAVAFEGLLSSGEHFASRLLGGFSEARKWPQLMHIATDGETYGHHHRHGDMALAYALLHIESNHLAKITNYGEYLAKHPPQVEAEIINNTSWSCAHGVERWRSNCGCNSGGHGDWNQSWREPLRNSLDWLRDELTGKYEDKAREFLKDPWRARDDYIKVVLDRSSDSLVNFFSEHQTHVLSNDEASTALKLLEMQRHLMLMYTSCGWFFDELSGIETVQVIFYAGRAIQLAQDLFGDHTEEQFLQRLALAKSNIPEHGNGALLYRKWVKPAVVNLLGVAAHYAISSLFDGYGDEPSIYCYDVDVRRYHRQQSGRARLALGNVRIRSRITLESADVSFGVLHFADHNLNAGVRQFQGEHAFVRTAEEISETFGSADLPGTLRLIDRCFEGSTYSLKSLFRDEQRRILNLITRDVLADANASYRHIYELHAPLMRFFTEVKMPLPNILRLTAEFVMNTAVRDAVLADDVDPERVRSLLDAARREGITLDAESLAYGLRKRLAEMINEVVADPEDLSKLERLDSMMNIAHLLPFWIDLWDVQNGYYRMLQDNFRIVSSRADDFSKLWTSEFIELGKKLNVAVELHAQQAPAAA